MCLINIPGFYLDLKKNRSRRAKLSEIESKEN